MNTNRNQHHPRNTSWRRLAGVLACSLALAPLAAQAEWVEWVGDASLTAKYRYNLNFSDFDEVTEEDWVAEARGSYGRFFQAAEATRIGVMAHVTGLAHERFDKLNGLITGADLVGIHKFGLGPTAPVLRLQATAEDLDIRDEMRNGRRYSGNVSLSRRFTDRLDATIGYTHSQRYGKRGTTVIAGQDTDVFDQRQEIWNIGASYLLTERSLLSLGYSRLDGEFATQCPNAGIGLLALLTPEIKAAAVDTVFNGRCTYRVEGDVDTYEAGLSYFLDETTSIDFGYKFRDGEGGSLDYTSYDLSMGISILF